jgi:RNA polymerase sigma factor (sigma-70 family)
MSSFIENIENYSLKNDALLWKEFLHGDIIAYEQIYRTYLPTLYNYGCKICPEESLVLDSIQELFITLLETRTKLSETNSIKFYLLKSLKTTLIRTLEKQKKRKDKENKAGFEVSFYFDENFDNNIDEGQIEKLKQALESLSPRQKEAITLRFYDNLSFEEIGEIMNIEVSSVYKILYKAIDNLHQKVNVNAKKPILQAGIIHLLFLLNQK